MPSGGMSYRPMSIGNQMLPGKPSGGPKMPTATGYQTGLGAGGAKSRKKSMPMGKKKRKGY